MKGGGERTWRETLEEEGAAVCRGVVSGEEVRRVIAGLERVGAGVKRRSGVGYAARNLLDEVTEVRGLVGSEGIKGLMEGVLGPGAFAVRAILFDKVPGANWPVGWHQDVVIAVKERKEVAGYGPWSVKAGVTHVRPGPGVLEGMVALRVHLDDCPAENGALKVVAGSHVGRWDDGEVGEWIRRGPVVTMEACAGDVVVMRPLVLHSSGPAEIAGHRRVR